MDHDAKLLRFLRARNFDIEQADEMYQNMLQWRKEMRMDNVLTEDFSTEWPIINRAFPHGYHKVDKYGRPLYIERVGQIKAKELFDNMSDETLLRTHVCQYEELFKVKFPACQRARNRMVETSFTVLDLRGAGYSIMLDTKLQQFIKLFTSCDGNNYPETMGTLVVANAPTIFSMIWPMIRGWLNARTVSKIHITSSNGMEIYKDYFVEEDIPDFLGGKDKAYSVKLGGTLNHEPGPWHDEQVAQANATAAKLATSRALPRNTAPARLDRPTSAPASPPEPVDEAVLMPKMRNYCNGVNIPGLAWLQRQLRDSNATEVS